MLDARQDEMWINKSCSREHIVLTKGEGMYVTVRERDRERKCM